MLISTKKKFIFVANTKAASSSIEKSLIRFADIYRHTSELGKHMPMERVLKEYDFLFDSPQYDISTFFKFGVIRDPVEWIISWFNFRSRKELANPIYPSHSRYLGNISFEEFWQRFQEDPGSEKGGQNKYCN